jgi:phosphatidylglycerophosphate synthase
MEYFDMYIILVIIIKVLFVITAITHLYYKTKGEIGTKKDKEILYWKDRLEFIFIILMAFLLIYLFNPRQQKPHIIDKETKILLYLFGFILLITAKWGAFFDEAKWFAYLQYILGKRNLSKPKE